MAMEQQNPEAVSATLAIIGANDLTTSKLSTPNETTGPPPKQQPDGRAEAENRESPAVDESALVSFNQTGLYRSVSVHMQERLLMQHPTAIQRRVLDSMLNLDRGQRCVDLLVRSPTGSGKTFAYLLPIAHYLLIRTKRLTREDGTLAVVVVPTRELADQVAEEAERLLRPWHWIVVGALVGGENKRHEKARLRKGVNVIVATPGRLLDHMRNTQRFIYRLCEFCVLDEADRLLDLGFEAEVKEILQNLNNAAQTGGGLRGGNKIRSNILLSATLRKDVERLAKFSLDEPIEITVASQKNEPESLTEKKFSMPLELRQHFCVVEQKFRLVMLSCFLRLKALKDVPEGFSNASEEALPPCKIIVFFSTCDSVDFHHRLFNTVKLPEELRHGKAGSNAEGKMIPLKLFKLHGNHSQPDRTAALREFRRSRRAVLLCTDVAARGLDLKGLTFAVQYDPPTGGDGEELEYLHRAGRTARMGRRGDALLFLLPSERAYIGKLEATGVQIEEISGMAALAALCPRERMMQGDAMAYGARLVTSAVHAKFEEIAQEDDQMKQMALLGFQGYCRAYATHAREARHFFHVRNLHLGHVARSFVISGKPAEIADLVAELRKAKAEAEGGGFDGWNVDMRETKSKRDIARAIADGEKQPYNEQKTTLARRRREKGKGHEAYKEIALEFGS